MESTTYSPRWLCVDHRGHLANYARHIATVCIVCWHRRKRMDPAAHAVAAEAR